MGVELAFSNALSEVTLVLFTTLGPASALAYLIMLVPLFGDNLAPELRHKIRKYLWVPLVACMFGLIASATHLGNPGNALYVLSRVGASSLSNEVFAAGFFLAACAIFWLLGFSLREDRRFEKVAIVIIAVLGVVFIARVAFAYNVETIVTWHTPVVPVAIATSAFVAGPLFAACVLRAVGYREGAQHLYRALGVLTVVAGVAWLALQVAYGFVLSSSSNALMPASALVPQYWPTFAVAVVLVVVGEAMGAWPLVRGHEAPIKRLVFSTAMFFLAIFLMRFAFYMAHMTVGVAL